MVNQGATTITDGIIWASSAFPALQETAHSYFKDTLSRSELQ